VHCLSVGTYNGRVFTSKLCLVDLQFDGKKKNPTEKCTSTKRFHSTSELGVYKKNNKKKNTENQGFKTILILVVGKHYKLRRYDYKIQCVFFFIFSNVRL